MEEGIVWLTLTFFLFPSSKEVYFNIWLFKLKLYHNGVLVASKLKKKKLGENKTLIWLRNILPDCGHVSWNKYWRSVFGDF